MDSASSMDCAWLEQLGSTYHLVWIWHHFARLLLAHLVLMALLIVASWTRLIGEQDVRGRLAVSVTVLHCSHAPTPIVRRTPTTLREGEKQRIDIGQVAHREVVHLLTISVRHLFLLKTTLVSSSLNYCLCSLLANLNVVRWWWLIQQWLVNFLVLPIISNNRVTPLLVLNQQFGVGLCQYIELYRCFRLDAISRWLSLLLTLVQQVSTFDDHFWLRENLPLLDCLFQVGIWALSWS